MPDQPTAVHTTVQPAALAATQAPDQIDELLRVIGRLKIERQQERDRAERLERENDRLTTIIDDWVLPALASGKRAAEESHALLDAIRADRDVQRTAEREQRHGGEDE